MVIARDLTRRVCGGMGTCISQDVCACAGTSNIRWNYE